MEIRDKVKREASYNLQNPLELGDVISITYHSDSLVCFTDNDYILTIPFIDLKKMMGKYLQVELK